MSAALSPRICGGSGAAFLPELGARGFVRVSRFAVRRAFTVAQLPFESNATSPVLSLYPAGEVASMTILDPLTGQTVTIGTIKPRA